MVSFFSDPTSLPQLHPGRHGIPHDEVVRIQRERMLSAAIRAIAANGYQRTNVSDVIAGAGVSRKTFYEIFDDMEDSFAVAFDVVAGATADAIADAAQGSRTWKDAVQAGAVAFADIVAANPDATIACLRDADAVASTRDRLHDWQERAGAFIDRGREGTPATVDIPAGTGKGVAGAVRSLALDGSPELRTEMVYAILAPFIGPRTAAKAAASAQKAPSRVPGTNGAPL
jgi:AcrR family transcriptional regulator